ncbi:PP2C family protein-serine/threonine phosphatase [Aquifex sp.]
MKWIAREIYKDKETYADRYFANGRMFAIADGLGIGKGAIFSAEFVVNSLRNFPPPETQEEMLNLFNELNKKLLYKLGELGDETISGTTLSLLSLTRDSFIVGHVGDSRIYLFKNGELTLLTEDQVRYKGNKKIVKVLGLEWNPKVHTVHGSLTGEERFVLLSDGFVSSFSEEVLKKALEKENIEEAADYLEERFKENSHKDDLTFLIIDLR